MVREVDHVVVITVAKAAMINSLGRPVTVPDARTGPGLNNKIPLHLVVQEVLYTRSARLHGTLVVPLWSVWHYSLESITQAATGTIGVFLHRGDDFRPVYPSDFQRGLVERLVVKRLLQVKQQ